MSLPSMVDRIDKDGDFHSGILKHMEDFIGVGAFDVGNEQNRFTTFISHQDIFSKARDLVRNWKALGHKIYGADATASDRDIRQMPLQS